MATRFPQKMRLPKYDIVPPRGLMTLHRRSLVLPLGVVAGLVLAAAAAEPAAAEPAQAPAGARAPGGQKPPRSESPRSETPRSGSPRSESPAANPAAQNQPQLLGQYGEWGTYTASPGGRKICFALAKPSSGQTSPPNRPRNPAYFFVTTRPGENVRNEVSTLVGYPLKANSDATAEVGGNSFVMYTQNDGAWIKNVAEEARLVDAMRKSSDLVIKGISGKGTQSTDTYSLKGLGQALDKMAQECK
jgi:Invasion associated locus B (IalB) protein